MARCDGERVEVIRIHLLALRAGMGMGVDWDSLAGAACWYGGDALGLA